MRTRRPPEDRVEPRGVGRKRRAGGLAARLLAPGLAAALTVGAGVAAAQESPAPAPPGSPPEIAANLGQFPAPNGDLTNSRDVPGSSITTQTVAGLTPAWTMPITTKPGGFGNFVANPIVTKDAVYLQDWNSNVKAVSPTDGKLLWSRPFSSPSPSGPNGVAVGDGMVFGATAKAAFALDAQTGALKWQHKLAKRITEGIDMAPVEWNGTVFISSIPGASSSGGPGGFYRAGARGVFYALDAQTGAVRWSFNTTTDNLWGNPKVNSGGGSWYPPSIDAQGRVYVTVANPAPYPGTPRFPNGTSRPGKNLYTDTLVALDGTTGKMLWHYQTLSHDLLDHDLQDPAILSTFTVAGKPTDVVVIGGKMGIVYVLNRDTGKLIWKRNVGRHNKWGIVQHYPLDRTVTAYPGFFGGVETPMAVHDGVIYAPVVNNCAKVVKAASTTACSFATSTGQMVALDGASGKVLWNRKFNQPMFSAATVANDVVFAGTSNGRIYGLSTKDGSTVWQAKLPAGLNAPPAVTATDVIVGAGVVNTKGQKPTLVDYRLPS